MQARCSRDMVAKVIQTLGRSARGGVLVDASAVGFAGACAFASSVLKRTLSASTARSCSLPGVSVCMLGKKAHTGLIRRL